MEDVELARCLLENDKPNLVVVKEGQILYSSNEKGLRPFFQAVLDGEGALCNAAVADRIVGSAVAMLCLHAGIASVYAGIVSMEALAMLKGHGVTITGENVVPYIFNYDGTDLCRFEKLAQECRQPSDLFSALQSLFAGGQ